MLFPHFSTRLNRVTVAGKFDEEILKKKRS
jgi:hypothetical protein